MFPFLPIAFFAIKPNIIKTKGNELRKGHEKDIKYD